MRGRYLAITAAVVLLAIGASSCSGTPTTAPAAATTALAPLVGTLPATNAATEAPTEPATATATVAPATDTPAPPDLPIAPSPTDTPAMTGSGVTFISVTGGPPGGTASVTVSTTPGAGCRISYRTPAGSASEANGLEPHAAGADGRASWQWEIGPGTKPGEGRVTVTCGAASATSPITIGG